MSEADDARVKRIEQVLDALKAPNLPADERAALERELDSIGRVLDPSFRGGIIVYSEFEAFIDRLLHRQGSIMPDFVAIRERKAELDHRFFERDSS